jgi:excinuclease ABC subunit B
VKGRVILYADKMTASITTALEITEKRREKQLAHNAEHGITPTSVKRSIDESLQSPGKSYKVSEGNDLMVAESDDVDVATVIAELETEMLEAAQKLEFEKAATLRDQIEILQSGKHLDRDVNSKKDRSKQRQRKKGVYNAKGLPKRR